MMTYIPHYPVKRALRLFSEELADAERVRRTAAIERETALDVGRWFVAQGKAVIAALEPLMAARLDAAARREARLPGGRLAESSPPPSAWDYYIAQVMRRPYGGASQLADILSGAHRRGYVAGSAVTRAQLGGNNPAFLVGNDDAVAYARAHAAERVTGIDETTRAELNRLISDAVDRRLTWRETADLIENKYADMAGPPLFPSRTHRRRAQMIAAFETRDAYEAGGYEQAARLQESGMDVEKRWVYLRDGRARPAHRANGDAGWVALEHVYADGHDRSPSDGGCRCVMMYRALSGAPAAPNGDPASVLTPDQQNALAADWFNDGLRMKLAPGRYLGDPSTAIIAREKERIALELAEATRIPAQHTAEFLAQWAEASNGFDRNSLRLQEAAAHAFGVPLSGWQRAQIAELERLALTDPGWRVPALFTGADGRLLPDIPYATPDEAYTALFQAMRRNTQRELAGAGIERVSLYRGIELRADEVILRDGVLMLERNALESFALERRAADRFAAMGHLAGDSVGLVVRLDAPVSRIVSTGRTGLGALTEGEFIVLAGEEPLVVEIIKRGRAAVAAVNAAAVTPAAATALLNSEWLALANVAATDRERRALRDLIRRLALAAAVAAAATATGEGGNGE